VNFIISALFVALSVARHYLILLDEGCMQGKSIVITGSSSGFGRAVAVRAYALGATVYAGCNRMQSVDELRAEYPDDPRMRPIKLNVSSEEDVAAAVEAALSGGVPLHAVVNNAGISAFGWAEVLPIERHAQNIDVNYLGAVRMTRAFLPHLREAHGRLVNMGSIGARMPSAFGSSYLPAKAAMLSYSECVRQEVYRHGVHVAYIEPGFFETSLLSHASANGAAHAANAAAKAPGSSGAPSCIVDPESRAAAYPSFEAKMAKTTEQIRTFERLNGDAAGVAHVVAATVDALCNRVPLTRYTVGVDAWLMRYVLVWLPDRLVDLAQTYL